ncbi:MAG: glycosyltransferase [Candidatus Pacebacteria bacterium]|nr:glycosyltransferase [Candidatus Paceibacterota bacterium]MDR3583432.1 glycosyltransferase [Candidatus Paceibacterota bacterium]
MYENQNRTTEQALSYPMIRFYPAKSRFDWRGLFYKSGIVVSGALLLFLIILLKSKTTSDFDLEPFLFSYAIIVTTFELSRVISAMLYEKSFESLTQEFRDTPGGEPYEPKIAFVIPCMNEERDIADAIIQCHQLDYPREKMEVIVVNDGSTDRTQLVLEELKKFYPGIKIISWENQGKRWGMAAGFKVSDAEIIIQLDSDSHVDPKTFRNLLDPFRNPQVGAVCAHGEPRNADENFVTRMQTAYYFMSFRILKAAESTYDAVFCCSGCCSAYRKSAVMPVIYHWLAETFLGKPVTWGDDRALTSWLIRTDWKTVYAKDALAYTVVPDTFKKLMKQQLRWKKSWIVNFFLTGKFIWKKQPFVSSFYYFPLIFISLMTPVMTFDALFWQPFVKGVFPIYHILGILMLTGIIALYYRYVDRKNKYWIYLFPWALVNLFVLSFVLVYAAFKIQDRGWGTR